MSESAPRRQGAGQPASGALIAGVDLEAARSSIAAVAVRTPTIACEDLAELAGTPVALKAECLQGTGSFKLRGALARWPRSASAQAPASSPRAPVTTDAPSRRPRAPWASAARYSCRATRPSPRWPPSSACTRRVRLEGASVEEALALAARRGEESGAALVHPFDDLDVIAGQGTLGLELLEDVPDLARVVVPVGGGGLASGVGIALRRAHPQIELVGVQASACAPYVEALRGSGHPHPRSSRRRDDRRRHRDQASRRADAAAPARAAGCPRDRERG